MEQQPRTRRKIAELERDQPLREAIARVREPFGAFSLCPSSRSGLFALATFARCVTIPAL